MFLDTDILQRNRDLVHATMGDETVLMSLSSGEYYGMNDIGSAVWNLLENEISYKELILSLTEKYVVSQTQCQADMENFLTSLRDKGILKVRDA
ncbi:MAG: PqqD family peptide modification chaperone [Acidiferrobacterales bacterium]|nr:PqqD family peptide modification chaperone [Acidiferrobacterales bacterium]